MEGETKLHPNVVDRALEKVKKKALEDPEWWTAERSIVITTYLGILQRHLKSGCSFEDAVRLTFEEIDPDRPISPSERNGFLCQK